MAVEGTLDLFKLPEILQLVSQQRKTGILTVQGQQDIVAISFLNGRIVAADALNQTLEEGLSQILLKEGMISAAGPGAGRLRAPGVRRPADRPAGGAAVHRARRSSSRPCASRPTACSSSSCTGARGTSSSTAATRSPTRKGCVPISVEELLINMAPSDSAAVRPQSGPAGSGQPSPAARPRGTRRCRPLPPKLEPVPLAGGPRCRCRAPPLPSPSARLVAAPASPNAPIVPPTTSTSPGTSAG